MISLSSLPGLGDKRIEDLGRLGVHSAEDLLRCFPKKYLDLRRLTPLEECFHNEFALVLGRVRLVPPSFPRGRLRTVKALCEQDGEPFAVIWFNQPYVAKNLKEDCEYLFYGRVQNKFGGVTLVNPSFEPLGRNRDLKGIVPVYTVKGSVTQRVMKECVRRALGLVRFGSAIPDELAAKYRLGDLRTAYLDVHFPSSIADKDRASERIALEEYFVLLSAFRYIKGKNRKARARSYEIAAGDAEQFEKRFPFRFTDGQKSAIAEIAADLGSGTVMNRLLQGDVGSGKTAVALAAIWFAVKSGRQAAFLAPTEVLAEQNFRLVQKVLPEYPAVFLAGSLTARKKTAAKKALASGAARIAVGTHAVIQKDVEFADLGFCVCDEQHRFGVAQRSALSEKGDAPDMLVMSATPIPRTLMLLFYGDLDVSVISDKPARRAEVRTHIVTARKYADMLGFIRGEAEKGNQAYFVCPKIEGDEEGEAMSATELFEDLKDRLPTLRFGLLHGRMKDKEKAEVMRDFKEKKYDCLVSTTVIEVGVDVPDATVMAICNADRFGLSQLHQLRGRVGRSDKESYCFLLSDSSDEKAIERLRMLKKSSDGFEIAEFDCSVRGGGDFLGTRQSGKGITDLGNLRYPVDVIFQAKKLCDEAELRPEYAAEVERFAEKKYEELKGVTLN